MPLPDSGHLEWSTQDGFLFPRRAADDGGLGRRETNKSTNPAGKAAQDKLVRAWKLFIKVFGPKAEDEKSVCEREL